MKNQRGFKPYEYDPDRRISFGKHTGTKWSEAPTSWLFWFAQAAYHQMVNRKDWAIQELKRRGVDTSKIAVSK